ncbi:hypothetical protein MTPG_00029 [Methylophilales phage HIM624-A]|nr:hypothetical protein MTPG_00029 [Methylophilales phage HIM624-A]
MTKRQITLPDGTQTDNYSQDYQRYCEALNLSKKSLMQRRAWLEKLSDEERVEQLKYWLKMLWGNQNL